MIEDFYKAESLDDEMTHFSFFSNGPKGIIGKHVVLTLLDNRDFYNLGFGDFDSRTGAVDDLAVSANGD